MGGLSVFCEDCGAEQAAEPPSATGGRAPSAAWRKAGEARRGSATPFPPQRFYTVPVTTSFATPGVTRH